MCKCVEQWEKIEEEKRRSHGPLVWIKQRKAQAQAHTHTQITNRMTKWTAQTEGKRERRENFPIFMCSSLPKQISFVLQRF